MPSALAALRRALGLPPGAGRAGLRRVGDILPMVVVPVTVRGLTADGADLRLLLEARLASRTLGDAEVERVAYALIEVAAHRWVRRQLLDQIADSIGPRLTAVEDAVREEATALGVDVLAIDVVAVEHLLVSPDPDPDPDSDPDTP